MNRKELINYQDPRGQVPFDRGIKKLRDGRARSIVLARLDRLEMGNPGVHKSVGEGVKELIIDFGPGYRVYYGEDGMTIVILLIGGDKGSQDNDIKKAHGYWAEYKRRK